MISKLLNTDSRLDTLTKIVRIVYREKREDIVMFVYFVQKTHVMIKFIFLTKCNFFI